MKVTPQTIAIHSDNASVNEPSDEVPSSLDFDGSPPDYHESDPSGSVWQELSTAQLIDVHAIGPVAHRDS